jgi:NAD/NADP transhydrogenase alpha subunit
VLLGTINVVGGFVVTDRMLEMFRSRGPGSQGGGSKGPDSQGAGNRG